ncbi:unnamed protein product [Lampetra planeri]
MLPSSSQRTANVAVSHRRRVASRVRLGMSREGGTGETASGKQTCTVLGPRAGSVQIYPSVGKGKPPRYVSGRLNGGGSRGSPLSVGPAHFSRAALGLG